MYDDLFFFSKFEDHLFNEFLSQIHKLCGFYISAYTYKEH